MALKQNSEPVEDALALLEQQHRTIEALFDRVAEDGEDGRRSLAQLAEALDMHAFVEEWHFYPALRRADRDGVVELGHDDHFEIKHALLNVLDLDAVSPELPGLLEELETLVAAHVQEEEDEVFSHARTLIPPGELDAMAVDMRETMLVRMLRGQPRDRVADDLASVATPV